MSATQAATQIRYPPGVAKPEPPSAALGEQDPKQYMKLEDDVVHGELKCGLCANALEWVSCVSSNLIKLGIDPTKEHEAFLDLANRQMAEHVRVAHQKGGCTVNCYVRCERCGVYTRAEPGANQYRPLLPEGWYTAAIHPHQINLAADFYAAVCAQCHPIILEILRKALLNLEAS